MDLETECQYAAVQVRKKLYSIYTVFLRRFTCCPTAFVAVWGGQTEREAPLADFKLHAARVRVCVGLAALAEVSYDVGGFWYQPVKINAHIRLYNRKTQSIVFVSDPQLRSETAQWAAEQVLALGGAAVMTGTLEKGSYSENLFQQGKMALLRYPVHLNHAQFEQLKGKNNFQRTISYHSKEFSAKREILF